MIKLITDAEAVHLFRVWRHGSCPCCQGELIDHYDGTEPAVIAEDVELCGRCIANEHHQRGDGEVLLAALVRGRLLAADAHGTGSSVHRQHPGGSASE